MQVQGIGCGLRQSATGCGMRRRGEGGEKQRLCSAVRKFRRKKPYAVRVQGALPAGNKLFAINNLRVNP
jgi:hypothetical protein